MDNSKQGRALVRLLGAIIVIIISAKLVGQDTTGNIPVFSVVSIKPNKTGDSGLIFHYTRDGFSAKNTNMALVIQEAYGLEESQVVGAPDWTKSEKYDIEARVDEADIPRLNALPIAQRAKMLQPVLTHYLLMTSHASTRELPVYALVIAKGGSKLKTAPPEEETKGHISFAGRNKITSKAMPIAALVQVLSGQNLGRVVVDKTGLPGIYDYSLNWALDDVTGQSANQAAGTETPAPLPSIFTAVQEQLGLRLEPQKAAVNVLIIDHIARPDKN